MLPILDTTIQDTVSMSVNCNWCSEAGQSLASMISTSSHRMASFHACLLLLVLFLQASMEVRASRSSFGFTSESGTLPRLRSLQEHRDSVTAKILSERNWQHNFSQKLLTRQMGSKPPDCDDKCNVCQPCQAVEVPISNRTVQKAQQDASNPFAANPDDTNYMPESWRCACGDTYYNP